jgi:hypothetical protein
MTEFMGKTEPTSREIHWGGVVASNDYPARDNLFRAGPAGRALSRASEPGNIERWLCHPVLVEPVDAAVDAHPRQAALAQVVEDVLVLAPSGRRRPAPAP